VKVPTLEEIKQLIAHAQPTFDDYNELWWSRSHDFNPPPSRRTILDSKYYRGSFGYLTKIEVYSSRSNPNVTILKEGITAMTRGELCNIPKRRFAKWLRGLKKSKIKVKINGSGVSISRKTG